MPFTLKILYILKIFCYNILRIKKENRNMVNVTELRPGNYFEEDGALFQVLDILLNKTAMRKMVAKLKVKNLRTGAIMEISRNSGYQMEVVKLDKRKMQYLYNSGDALVFMDQNTYDQIEIPVERMEWESKLLRGDEEVDVVLYNDEVMGVSLPSKVALTITECEPAVKGDTVNKAMKVAILETGLQIKVPLFISQGEVVLVRTDNGEYDGRA